MNYYNEFNIHLRVLLQHTGFTYLAIIVYLQIHINILIVILNPKYCVIAIISERAPSVIVRVFKYNSISTYYVVCINAIAHIQGYRKIIKYITESSVDY